MTSLHTSSVFLFYKLATFHKNKSTITNTSIFELSNEHKKSKLSIITTNYIVYRNIILILNKRIKKLVMIPNKDY